jgi:hypothetical protein
VSPVGPPVGSTGRIICQGKALVRAIEALETIDVAGPLDRAMVSLLLHTYRRRLRGPIELAPRRVGEATLSASERIGDDRVAPSPHKG